MLSIKEKEKKKISATYEKTWYLVVSDLPLTQERLQHLRKGGFLGWGQEWYVYDAENSGEVIPLNLHGKVIEDRCDTSD